MVNLQKEFIDFHDTIKLTDENDTLREKREILLNKLKDKISDEAASYTTFCQGSYAMNTGIKPDDSDFDIDIGVRFDISKDDYSDVIVPKKWVKDALDGHTKKVEIKRSCVTVTYQVSGELQYHVDFAIYAASNLDGCLYIAKGKEHSTPENKYWEISDPIGLIDKIQQKFSGDDAAQFRRVIRYLKKWKNVQFTSTGNSAPTGISLTILAYNLFSVSKTYDYVANKYIYDDFSGLMNLISSIKSSFSLTWSNDDEVCYHTITVELPVQPKNNLFEKMTTKQMDDFYKAICAFYDVLLEVKGETSKSKACELLIKKVFGNDFPLTVDKSVVGTSQSAFGLIR